ncbi:MAG TPA: 2,3-diphosphoglycerate-dependent phosphoglycerate mutase [Acidimicrobiales bacterium]|nr:2,3-diphosphoglycerate-dependent phosphoglycerate mutase [Acidimicrobiales bacterium]
MGTLVLVRHGQSQWNLENRFTGWWDVPLSDLGQKEARDAGAALAAAGVQVDRAFTSVLARAVNTANLLLDEMGQGWVPVSRSWRLNERHYGGLTGLDKDQVRDQYGEEQFLLWRRSYDVPPPPLPAGSPYDVSGDRRYRGLPAEIVPATECLADVVRRMLPYWFDAVAPVVLSGGTALVAAHGNSLRALVKHLEGISDADIPALEIPTGLPLVYELDADLGVVSKRELGA